MSIPVAPQTYFKYSPAHYSNGNGLHYDIDLYIKKSGRDPEPVTKLDHVPVITSLGFGIPSKNSW